MKHRSVEKRSEAKRRWQNPKQRALACSVILLVMIAAAIHVRAFDNDPHLEPLFTIEGFTGYSDFQSPDCFFVEMSRERIYIADSVEKKIFVYSSEGTSLAEFDIVLELEKIISLAVYEKNIYVLHGRGIAVVDQSSRKVREMEIPENLFEKMDFKKIVADERGNVFIQDDHQQYIYKFIAGEEEAGFVAFGKQDDRKKKDQAKRFEGMADVYLEDGGRVHVLNAKSKNVEIYDSKGKLIGNLLREFSMNSVDLYSPELLAVDSFDKTFIYDSSDRIFKVFNSAGFYEGRIEAYSEEAGQHYMFPSQIFIDDMNRLFILDGGDRMLKIFEIKGMI